MPQTDPHPEAMQGEPASDQASRPEAKPARQRRQSKALENQIPRPDPNQKVTTETKTTTAPRETKKEVDARLSREAAEHAQMLWERQAVFISGLVLFGVIIVAAVASMVFSQDAQLRVWATASLTSLLLGYLGYMVGYHQGKKP